MARNDLPKVPVGDFVTSAAHAIPVAGMLEAKPELRTSELTETQWQAELDAYLGSPPPSDPVVEVAVAADTDA